MKREDVLKILENTELNNDSKIDQILNMRGAELNASNARIKTLEDTLSKKEQEHTDLTEKYKDYDAILNERNTLAEEKAEKARQERFSVVLGENKPKNEYTREGRFITRLMPPSQIKRMPKKRMPTSSPQLLTAKRTNFLRGK